MTEPTPCPVATKHCGTPRRGLAICNGCIRRLQQNLRSCEETRQQLMVTLARQDHIGAGGEKTKHLKPGSMPSPINLNASAALHEIRNELAGWVRIVNIETGDPLPANRIATMATWLDQRIDHLAKHKAAADMVRGVRHVLRKAETAIDIPRDKTKVRVGPCPEAEPTEDDAGAYCPGTIVAYIPQDRSDYRPCLMCTHEGCAHEGTEWTAERWARMGKRIRARQGVEDMELDEKAVRRLVEAVLA